MFFENHILEMGGVFVNKFVYVTYFITIKMEIHTSKKHGNGQAECGEWCFHRGSLAEILKNHRWW